MQTQQIKKHVIKHIFKHLINNTLAKLQYHQKLKNNSNYTF